MSLPATTPASENHATGLATDFGAALLRLSADHLLRELQAKFGNIPHVDEHMTATMLRYILEELDIWRRPRDFFTSLQNVFDMYEVPHDIRAKLTIPLLTGTGTTNA